MTTNNVTNNYRTSKVVQVVFSSGGGSSTSSTSAVDITGTATSIIPTSSSNNILVMVSIPCHVPGVAATNVSMSFQVLRGMSVIGGSPHAVCGSFNNNGGTTSDEYYGICSFCYLDSPATTSATTYKLQQYSSTGSNTVTTSNVNVMLLEVQP